MKKTIFLLLSFLFLTQNIYTQTLVEKLGGATTNFQMVHNGRDLQIISQNIVPRGHLPYKDDLEAGYGNKVFVLEFISKREIERKDVVVYSLSSEREKIKMIFYANNGSVLFERTFSGILDLFDDGQLGGTEDDRLYFYTVSLEGLPITLLAKTAKIEFLLEWEILPLKKAKNE